MWLYIKDLNSDGIYHVTGLKGKLKLTDNQSTAIINNETLNNWFTPRDLNNPHSKPWGIAIVDTLTEYKMKLNGQVKLEKQYQKYKTLIRDLYTEFIECANSDIILHSDYIINIKLKAQLLDIGNSGIKKIN